MSKIFDAVLMPAALYPALQRICCAVNVMHEERFDKTRFWVETMALHHDRSETQRVWWHIKSNGQEEWISLNPGEYRSTAPQQPYIMKEMPDGQPRIGARSMLQGALESAGALPAASFDEQEILDAAEFLSIRDEKQGSRRLGESIRKAKFEDRQAYQEFTSALFEEYLLTFGCSLDDFTSAMMLFRLPQTLGNSIAEDWSSDPVGYLKAYLDAMLSGAQQTDSRRRLADVAKLERDAARRLIDQGLSGTMSAMSKQLTLAAHSFLTADILVRALLRNGLPESALPFQRNLADEGFACTNTGLQMGAAFCMAHPDVHGLNLRSSAKQHGGTVDFLIERQTGPIEPIFTQTFGEILRAQLKVQSADRGEVEAGLRDLLGLQQECNSGDDFAVENCWIDHSLLGGYRRLGDEKSAESIAFKIAGQLVARKALF